MTENEYIKQNIEYPKLIFLAANIQYDIEPDDLQDWRTFENTYIHKMRDGQDHRVVAVLAALIVETAIDKTLTAWLPLYNATLLERSDFTHSMKEALLKALLIAPPIYCEASGIVRKIRNEFAHNIHIENLNQLANSKPGLIVKLNAIIPKICSGYESQGRIDQDLAVLASMTASGLFMMNKQIGSLRTKLADKDLIKFIFTIWDKIAQKRE